MKINFDHFYQNLPATVREFLSFCLSNKIQASIIGGITRDYLLNNTMGSDFDICLRPLAGISKRVELIQIIKTKYPNHEEKKYGVIDLGNGIEIAWPRVEIFSDKLGHSNFEVEFISDQDFTKDVLRRDFTINAISFLYTDTGFQLKDPVSGVMDLRHRILRACDSQTFIKDPVRFLRAHRFKILLDYEFEPTLKILLANMQLKLSSHYLKMEALKSKRPLIFYREIIKVQNSIFNLNLNFKEIDDFQFLVQNEPLANQIGLAYFIPKDTRIKLLESLNLKKAILIEFNPNNIDLTELLKLNLLELQKLSYITSLINFLNFTHQLSQDFLNQFEFKNEMPNSFYHDYLKLKITAKSETPKPLRNLEIFQSKLRTLL